MPVQVWFPLHYHFFCFLNLNLGDSSEFHCGKLEDESIGLVLNNAVHIKMKTCPVRSCWFLVGIIDSCCPDVQLEMMSRYVNQRQEDCGSSSAFAQMLDFRLGNHKKKSS